MKTRDLQTITLNIRNQQFPKINIYYSTKGIPSEYNRAEEKKKKTDELICPMHPNSAHTLRLTKHHMKQLDLKHINIENYKLST